MFQRKCSWSAVKYINISGYVLRFNTDYCFAVPKASHLGIEFAFLDALLLAWYAVSSTSPTTSC